MEQKNEQLPSPRASRGDSKNRVNKYYSGPVSDHFDGTFFFNPGGRPPNGLRDLLKWQFGEKRNRWPARFDSPFSGAAPVSGVDGDDLRVTMVGHATMLIQVAGLNILTDPVWAQRVSPLSFVGPKRVNAPGIAFDRLPDIDLVLLTHNHYDHLDIETLKRLHKHHKPLVVTPLGNDKIVHEAVKGMQIRTGDWGDSFEVAGGVRIHIEPCHHWSARGSRDRRMALWGAFILETPAGRIYHVGDTGFHGGVNYRAAFRKFGGFRLAILPIGAFEPRWFMKDHHQNPREAVEGFEICAADHAVGHHWGTFPLTNEAIDEPLAALKEALRQKSIDPARFRPLRPGESWDVPADAEQSAGAGENAASGNL
ncbi:MBL fold metallo-hydrolase [Nitratireductor sp. XY-223]|uniref:MBL fold metallo-hydrolase n=1 Tax=Nitratireductor sp. XY-223 TaxID=2561926 RepID=UPI0010AB296C|nr:MBL fold metallo-hydrolase [Nitratireductor sp. XY-223]